MLQKKYTVYSTEENLFDLMCQSLLSQIRQESNVIKVVFFGSPKDNEDYLKELYSLTGWIDKYFPENPPLISYVAQEPFKCKLIAEVTSLISVQNINISYGENYIILDYDNCRELITGGILPADIFTSHTLQSDNIFDQIEEILLHEDFPLNSIVRQWNYIENICSYKDGDQNYQEFNDSRSKFYAKTTWIHGYPAATGIGTHAGGVMVELIALAGESIVNRPVDNPLQIAAHQYSQSVLHGATDLYYNPHTTPKFERARVVGLKNSRTVFISGTAAIRGEASVFEDDIADQVFITMENIENLLSSGSYPENFAMREIQMCRIYVKNKFQMEEVNTYMTRNFPGLKFLLVCADICRDELLVEIEGISMSFINP